MDKQIIQLIGKQYKACGRGPDVYDCWGLAIAASKIINGIEIPDYKLDPANTEQNAFLADVATNDGSWEQITAAEPKPGLIVAFQFVAPGLITHVGVTIGSGRFIQCSNKKGVTIEMLKKYQKLIEGYYEYTGKK